MYPEEDRRWSKHTVLINIKLNCVDGYNLCSYKLLLWVG